MRIGLALSGGGFRATLFHLGVVRFLADAKLLKNVVYVSSVSGGSVLGAHLLLNWERYNDADQFETIARDLICFAKRDVRGRILRRRILGAALGYTLRRLMPPNQLLLLVRLQAHAFGSLAIWHRGLTRLFTEECEHLVHHERLGALDGERRPLLEMLTTSLSNGLSCIFSHRGLTLDQGPGRPSVHVDAETIPVSLAIAASAALPPLFPAVELSYQTLGVLEAEMPIAHFATDGGVYDSLGIQMLRWSDDPMSEALDLDTVVMSDAGAPFDITHQADFTNPLSRNLRATEVMMYRNSVLTVEALHADGYANKIVECRIGNISDLDFGESPKGKWHKALRRTVAQIRTDFDRFSDGEINLLVRHGYVVARDAFRRWRPADIPEDLTPWLPLPAAAFSSKADIGTEVVLWSMPLDDGATWVILVIALLCLAGAAIVAFSLARWAWLRW